MTETKNAAVEQGRNVLLQEARGLTALADSLGDSFSEVVDLIANVRGRVIVSGMGKSGHVAHKIAATLASTGTPAYFVHPAEASHGDLGMVTRDDVVLALSNSGETAELANLITYTRRYSISLIALTMGQGSRLAQHADHILALPKLPEACPMGLAPTTSTTMALALGDALAVALLQRKRFTAQEFGTYHPGGSLGGKLMPVSSLMSQGEDIPRIDPDTPMSDAMLIMSAKRMGCALVTDDEDRLLGIVTDGDIRRHFSAEIFHQTAGSLMTSQPVTIAPDALLAEAVAQMNDRKITVLPVTQADDKVCGVLHLHDCLRAGVS